MKNIFTALAMVLLLAACGKKGNDFNISEGPLTDAQKKEWLGKFESVKALTEKDITGTWEIVAAKAASSDKEAEQFMNTMFEKYAGNSYDFRADGTFTCHAIIDSDGKWSLINDGTTLRVENNVRKDVEEHKVLMENGHMIWMLDAEGSQVFQFFNKQ